MPTLAISPQLEAAKKAYHLACKEEKLAMTREMNSKTEQSVTPEQQKKLLDKVDKCKQDVQKVPVERRLQLLWWLSGWPDPRVAAGTAGLVRPPPSSTLAPADSGEV